jgi:hypothetical protein
MRRKRWDGERVAVARQRDVLRDVMLCARECEAWLTLRELARMTGYGEASISAQLRHLRKPECGGFAVEKRCRQEGRLGRMPGQGAVWEYRLRRSRRAAKKRRDWLTPAVLRGVVRAARQTGDQTSAAI